MPARVDTTEAMLTDEDYTILAGLDPNGLSSPHPMEPYREADKQAGALCYILAHDCQRATCASARAADPEKWRDLHAFPREYILGWRE